MTRLENMNPRRMFEVDHHKIAGPEDFDDKEMRTFRDFIKENKYTAEQMRQAYYHLLEKDDGGEMTPQVAMVLSKMREMTFPLSRFPILIKWRMDHEDGVPAYRAYIDSLEISESGKEVLRSIIDEEKDGEIVCMVGSTIMSSFRVHVKGLGKSIAIQIILKKIRETLEQIPKDKRYEITFSEL